MIWIVLSIACLLVSFALVLTAWQRHRRTRVEPVDVMTQRPVAIAAMPASNENATGVSITFRRNAGRARDR